MSKLSLDRDKIDQSKKIAEQIVSPIYHLIERHTTVSIERCVLRLLGVEGSLEEHPKKEAPQGRFPLVNRVVDKIEPKDLSRGVGYWFGLAATHYPKLDPVTLARKIINEEIKIKELKPLSFNEVDRTCQKLLRGSLEKLRTAREGRSKRPPWKIAKRPLRYVIVATGNIFEDIVQAQAAAEMGADIIAVIRSTAQSLLDYVPEGETTEGFGGTFATQDNFRLMREALDETEKKLKRKIALTNYSSGLCMPEIAVIGALEGVDYLLNDAMYGILFRDINMERNFIDQNFSRRMCALSGITIQTGEDNYLTTAESFKYWYQVLSSHFINQAFAKKAGIADQHLALGHAFEMDPWIEDSMLLELAQAQLVREIFPRSPLKFMPPTKHKTGDIFFSYLQDGLFNLTGILTGQTIQLLGMHTEAIHNPHIQDRYLSLKNADYIFNAAKSASYEILFQPHGKIARRARQVLDDSLRLLKKIRFRGLFRAIEEGAFANVRRSQRHGKGLEGVIPKHRDYYTPLHQYLIPRSLRAGAEGLPPRRRRGERRGGEPSRSRRRPTPTRAPKRAPRRRDQPAIRQRAPLDSRAGSAVASGEKKPFQRRDLRTPVAKQRQSPAMKAPVAKQPQPINKSEVILLPPPREISPKIAPPTPEPKSPPRTSPVESQAPVKPKDPLRRPANIPPRRPLTGAGNNREVDKPEKKVENQTAEKTGVVRRPLPRRALKQEESPRPVPEGGKPPQENVVTPEKPKRRQLPRRQLNFSKPGEEEKPQEKPSGAEASPKGNEGKNEEQGDGER